MQIFICIRITDLSYLPFFENAFQGPIVIHILFTPHRRVRKGFWAGNADDITIHTEFQYGWLRFACRLDRQDRRHQQRIGNIGSIDHHGHGLGSHDGAICELCVDQFPLYFRG